MPMHVMRSNSRSLYKSMGVTRGQQDSKPSFLHGSHLPAALRLWVTEVMHLTSSRTSDKRKTVSWRRTLCLTQSLRTMWQSCILSTWHICRRKRDHANVPCKSCNQLDAFKAWKPGRTADWTWHYWMAAAGELRQTSSSGNAQDSF